MSDSGRTEWDERHRGQPLGAAEPFVVEMLDRIPRTDAIHSIALDVAAGRGRNALAIARAGIRVVAVDFSIEAMQQLAGHARAAQLAVWPVVANLDSFQLKENSFDAIVNVNFLDRALFAQFQRALKPGGILIADTFLIDQAAIGHPRDRRFLLAHGELRTLAGDLTIEEYREGLVNYPNGTSAYRASIVARRGTSRRTSN
jgi:SAM-dependent methyltransferase